MWGKYESFTFWVCHSTFLEKVKEQTTIQTFNNIYLNLQRENLKIIRHFKFP